MAIITKQFSAYYEVTSAPAPGLTVTIDIRQLDLVDPASLVVSAAAMTDRGGGFYTYDYTSYDTTKNYGFVTDGGGALATWERYKSGMNTSESAEEIVDQNYDEPLLDHLVVDSVGEALAIIRGLTKQNFILDSTTYSVNNVLLTGRVRVWDTAANVGTPTGIIATYQISAIEGTPGTVTQHKMERVP